MGFISEEANTHPLVFITTYYHSTYELCQKAAGLDTRVKASKRAYTA